MSVGADGYYSLHMPAIAAALVNAVNEQSRTIKEQARALDEQRRMIGELRERRLASRPARAHR